MKRGLLPMADVRLLCSGAVASEINELSFDEALTQLNTFLGSGFYNKKVRLELFFDETFSISDSDASD